jgi:DNA-directed RNA polymerase subunit N (RpoN/RPB10)
MPESQKEAMRAHFASSSKQFDTYSIFFERALSTIKEGGRVCFVIPDSILTLQNRQPTRRMLLEETRIAKLILVGDVFPGSVVSSVVILAEKPRAREDDSDFLVTIEDIREGQPQSVQHIPQAQFIMSNYSLGGVIPGSDLSLVATLEKYALTPRAFNHDALPADAITLGRGVEIGKKGLVSYCPNCDIYFPTPKRPTCPTCASPLGDSWSIFQAADGGEPREEHLKPIVLGLQRWKCSRMGQVLLGIPGINYKQPELYSANRITIRQLLQQRRLCVALPPSGALTTQSVYNLNLPPSFDAREFIGILNSEIIAALAHQVFSGGKKLFPRVLLHVLNDLPLIPRESPSRKARETLVNVVNQFLADPNKDVDPGLQNQLNLAVLSYFSCNPEDQRQVLRAVGQFRAEVLNNE